MENLKALIIGYGSIGRRHFEVLSKMSQIIKQIDIVTSKDLSSLLPSVRTYKNLESIKELSVYDYFIIATPTNRHFDDLAFLDSRLKNKIIFCEKPLFDVYKNAEFVNNKIYVGFVLRYHPFFEAVREFVAKNRVYFVEVSCGSYLPNWRVGGDYRECYSAKKEQGGGVLLDLSHEIDYLEWCFGKIVEVCGVNEKISELEISSDDVLSVVAKTERGALLNLTLNYFSKISRREIFIHAESDTLRVDLVNNIMEAKSGKIEAKLERNDMFLAMHKDVLRSFGSENLAPKNYAPLLPTFRDSLYTCQILSRMKNMKLKQNILCVIGCRGGSKGVKNKNIRPLCGKPLLSYTIIQALQSRLFSHIVLSTDSKEIADIGAQYGAEVFFLRDATLADDSAGKLPAIRDALLRSEKHFNTKFDVVMDLDATSPLREVSDITEAYAQFVRDDNDILITAAPARKSPYFNLVEKFDVGGREVIALSKRPEKPILRRQDSPKCFDMNASIYIWKRDALLENESVFVENTGLFVMPESRSVDIDTEIDFEFVEFMMSKKLAKNATYSGGGGGQL